MFMMLRRSSGPLAHPRIKQMSAFLYWAGTIGLVHRDLIIALAARYRLPAIYTEAVFPGRWADLLRL